MSVRGCGFLKGFGGSAAWVWARCWSFGVSGSILFQGSVHILGAVVNRKEDSGLTSIPLRVRVDSYSLYFDSHTHGAWPLESW